MPYVAEGGIPGDSGRLGYPQQQQQQRPVVTASDVQLHAGSPRALITSPAGATFPVLPQVRLEGIPALRPALFSPVQRFCPHTPPSVHSCTTCFTMVPFSL